MRPLNAAVLIAVLTTTQCKTTEGQRAESASATCAADTVRNGRFTLIPLISRPWAQYSTADYSTVNMHIDGGREAEGLQIPARLRVMGGPVHSPILPITITDAQLTETRLEPPKDADRIQ